MNRNPLQLYTCFHLNIAYSSIPEQDRGAVVRQCYRPLLDLVLRVGFRCGIEASAYTLEEIQKHDPSWIDDLAGLIASGACEFIASGYSQAIGPLLPAEVNAANLAIGNRRYREMLGSVPRIVLVNEQAYSSGMISHYLAAGYQAMLMEWNNPALTNGHWDPEWRYLPQVARDQHGRKIPVIWNNCIYFQKFQHYAHGEKELGEYLSFIASHQAPGLRTFPLYGNDVEIFDFRPGRYHTEAQLGSESEWDRIGQLFQILKDDGRFRIVSPGDVLGLLGEPGAGNEVSLETSAVPVPVKKQEKYNISRWAVTGRDDLGINSSCRRIHDALLQRDDRSPEAWQELCYLWSSDFRTHITEPRWDAFRSRLSAAEAQYCGAPDAPAPRDAAPWGGGPLPGNLTVLRKGRILSLAGDAVRVDLNTRRGLALDGLWFPGVAPDRVAGTLSHGYYDDITLGADFYSGHLTFETTGRQKVTDLEPVEPALAWSEAEQALVVSSSIASGLGTIVKRVLVYPSAGAVAIEYELQFESLPVGSLHLGHLTLCPDAFDQDAHFYRTHNGGAELETFHPGTGRINHGESASFLVSAKHALGLTGGVLELGDAGKFVRVSVDTGLSSLVGLIAFVPLKDSFFFRVSLSAREMDETSKPTRLDAPLRCRIVLTGSN